MEILIMFLVMVVTQCSVESHSSDKIMSGLMTINLN
jgi:hypothetical protein